MKTEELTDLQQMIALWKEKGIVRGEFEFNCGGDQMNDTSISFRNEAGEEVESEELTDYFDNEVYNQVEFYVNSDGHYQGEMGNVYIELVEEEDEEPYFSYTKEAESEWNESFTEIDYCTLTPEEAEFVKDKIHSIVGGNDGEAINYKTDCILSNEEEAMIESISRKVDDFATEYQFKEAEGEENDWFTYTTDIGEANSDSDVEYDEDNPTLIKGNTIAVVINKSFTIFKAD